MRDPVRVVLAEDHGVLRGALRRLLDAEPGFAVAGEAASGIEALRAVKTLRPDLLVLDLSMPGLGGMEVLERLPRATRAVVLTRHEDYAHVHEAFRRGAAGYVVKRASVEDLVHALREARAGRRYLSPPLTERGLAGYARRRGRGGKGDPLDVLTPREREVLVLSADGKSSTTAAWLLGISPRTVESHRARAMEKLGLRHRADLVRFAIRRGLVSDRDDPA